MENRSPRIQQLIEQLATGHGALDLFWQEVQESGTPLVEQIAGDEEHLLVTFLWRDEADVDNVVVVVPWRSWSVADYELIRLADTWLWYRTFVVPRDMRSTYSFSLNDAEDQPYRERMQKVKQDPLSRSTMLYPAVSELGIQESVRSAFVLPQAYVQSTDQPAELLGQVEWHHFAAGETGESRRVYVYTPSGYSPDGAPYPLMILFDGSAYLHLMNAPQVIEQLHTEGAITPPVVVMLDHLNREQEMNYNETFLRMLTDELLPWLHKAYHVTTDPSQVIIGGSSMGGMFAAFAGLRRPDLFGHVLSQSGAYWWQHPDDPDPHWLSRQYAATERLPLTFYMENGTHESERIIVSNQVVRATLLEKGYRVHGTEFSGGHDFFCWASTFEQGLRALLGTSLLVSSPNG